MAEKKVLNEDTHKFWQNLDHQFPGQDLPFIKGGKEEYLCQTGECLWQTRRLDGVYAHFQQSHTEQMPMVKRIIKAYMVETGKSTLGLTIKIEDLN